MKAVCWMGKNSIEVQEVPDPQLLNPRDAIVRITSTAICGSDLHLYDGFIPTMMAGDILGHEFMGIIEEVGPGVRNLKAGDRVVVPFAIGCGNCYFCTTQQWSLCDNSNPNAHAAEKLYGYSGSGLFGYSHLYGGYSGGQAQYVRVPFADVGPLKIENSLPDDRLLFLTDIFPTGYMAAENANIQPGDTVAVWGCGPVGQFAIASAFLMGAKRVIAIDKVPERLDLAEKQGAESLDFSQIENLVDVFRELTGGVGPDSCIDAVGMEAHGPAAGSLYDSIKQTFRMEMDRPTALRYAIQVLRKGGTLSIPGVYGGVIDKVPFGAAFGKGITMKMGQTHVHRYLKPLLNLVESGKIDPSVIITHKLPLSSAPEAYKTFRDKQDECIKVVLDPWDQIAA